MGEHGTWTDFLLHFSWFQDLSGDLKTTLGRQAGTGLFATHFTLTHVLWALVVLAFVLYGSLVFYRGVRGKDGIVPPRGFNLRNVFEGITDATYGSMVEILGEKKTRQHLPLIGSLALFIFFSNVMALIPGFGVPTATLKTNLVLGLIVFFATHYYGLKEHGIGYVKHFLGPWMPIAPLMLPIEIISHVARPVSLSLRLMGNMAADHKVVFTFFTLVPLVVPVPFLFLGLLVATIQTFVFCILSVVYISMATAHDH